MSPGVAELAKKFLLKDAASAAISIVVSTGATDEVPVNSSVGLKCWNQAISSGR
jgi:hypothetical protein